MGVMKLGLSISLSIGAGIVSFFLTLAAGIGFGVPGLIVFLLLSGFVNAYLTKRLTMLLPGGYFYWGIVFLIPFFLLTVLTVLSEPTNPGAFSDPTSILILVAVSVFIYGAGLYGARKFAANNASPVPPFLTDNNL